MNIKHEKKEQVFHPGPGELHVFNSLRFSFFQHNLLI